MTKSELLFKRDILPSVRNLSTTQQTITNWFIPRYINHSIYYATWHVYCSRSGTWVSTVDQIVCNVYSRPGSRMSTRDQIVWDVYSRPRYDVDPLFSSVETLKIYLYLYKYKNVCLSVCLFVCNSFSRPFRNRLGYPLAQSFFQTPNEF